MRFELHTVIERSRFLDAPHYSAKHVIVGANEFGFLPATGKVAIKVVNHYGDELLTVLDLPTSPKG